MGIIVAIGGYKRRRTKDTAFDTPLKIDRQIVELTGKQKPKVLFIPTASSDDASYVRAIHEVYGEKLGCTVMFELITENPHAEMQQDPLGRHYLWWWQHFNDDELWRRLGVDLLKEAYARCRVLRSPLVRCWFEYGERQPSV
jgi:dipeptidase E